MTDDLRTDVRRRTLKGGRIVINNGRSTFDCTMRNFSQSGARLTLPSILGIPESFELVLDDGQRFDCTVVWRTATDIGVKFTELSQTPK